MDRNDFYAALKQMGIDPETVSFDSGINDGYNIRKNHFRWEVFTRERGAEYGCVGFSSESDALQYLLCELIECHNN